MQYDLGNISPTQNYAVHASDLFPLFWNKDWDLIDYILARFNVSKETAELFTKGMANFAPDYQSYMFSYAVTGDPNKFKQNNLPTWPLATDNGNEVIVLNTGNGFTSSWSVKPDTINTKNACDFWAKAAATIMAAVKAHRG